MSAHSIPAPAPQARRRPIDPVRSIMARPLATVDSAASVLDVAAELAADDVGAVLVIGSATTGLLSERDIVIVLGTGGDVATAQAGDVATTDLVWAGPDESISDVAQMMLDSEVRHVPVGDGHQAVGIVSIRDVLAVLLH